MWRSPPTLDNITKNTVVGWLEPDVPCLSFVDNADGTSKITYSGLVAYVVTACLTFVT